MTNNDVVNSVYKFMGVPYHHQGRCLAGTDCIGLIFMVFYDLKYTEFSYTNYSSDWHLHRGEEKIKKYCDIYLNQKPIEKMEAGNILLFRIGKGLCCSHIGFYVGNNNMIHSYAEAKKVVKHVIDKTWFNRIKFCYELKGIK